jgi:biotin carboxylase
MAEPELLQVGIGIMGTPYIAAARGLGARIRLIETEPHLSRLAGEVDEAVAAPGTADEAWAAAACAAAARRRPDGVLAAGERHVIAAALVQDELGLPGPGLRAAVISRNKGLQRARLAQAGVPQPEHVVVDDLSAARDWALVRLPVVVKPLSSSGSAGVELVPDVVAFDRAAACRAGRLAVEAMVSGPEYSYEGLISAGHVVYGNVTEKETLGPPGFVEVCHRPGHRFEPGAQQQVDELVAQVVAGLGMSSGIVHLEFRHAPAGPVLIEVAVRTPGDYLMDAISLTAGFDLYRAVVSLALDLPLDIPATTEPVAFTATWMVTAEPGRIVAVDGLDEVRRHPGVVRAQLRRQVGDLVAPLRSSLDRVGHVLIRARTAAERDATLAFVRDRLRIITKRVPASGE